ncbi:MAG TPA: hypothetical protein VFV34_26095 [Blastocatellia bacterium]|nr:hypothetical protein [Blastocatellia bacterium]
MEQFERQAVLDEEHLKLLWIGYLILGVLNLGFAFFPLIYVAFGLFFALADLPSAPGEGPPPQLLGWLFVVVGLVVSAGLMTVAALKLLTARAIRQRRNPTLCMITAAISCLTVPFGTVLGVATFLVLSRPTVKRLFSSARPSPWY